MNDERPVVDETVDEAEDEDEVQFWPIWPTAARSLRKGDQIAGPVGPQTFLRATIADLQEDEPSGTIPIIAELVHPLGDAAPTALTRLLLNQAETPCSPARRTWRKSRVSQ